MPLPPALLTRLAQRGLVKGIADQKSGEARSTREVPDVLGSRSTSTNASAVTSASELPEQEEEEEIFAEDYDNVSGAAVEIGPRLPKALERARRPPHELLPSPAVGCPNKSNAHHRCVVWCTKRWGNGIATEDPALARKRQRMLRKYPLPSNWMEEYDPGTGRFYYWHRDGKQVCWLSPTHPRAEITMPAQKFREVLLAGDDGDVSGDSGSDSDEAEQGDEEETLVPPGERNVPTSTVSRGPVGVVGSGVDRKRRRRDGRGDNAALDPMDPASYSDTCPRGGWSAGLESVTGGDGAADHTASGPLFQQRPYPSPGDVLRRNKSKTD